MSESNNTKLKDYLIYFLALVILVLGIKTCNLPEGKIKIIKTTDTITKIKINTVKDVDTLTLVKWKEHAPKDGTEVNLYYDTLKNDTVEVYLKAEANKLYSTELKAKAKVFTTTITRDSIITITNNTTRIDTVTKKTIGYTLNGGLHSRVAPTGFDIGPVVHFNTPVGALGYGYGIISKSHQVFLTIPIIKPKK